jgi:hypothetical protein
MVSLCYHCRFAAIVTSSLSCTQVFHLRPLYRDGSFHNVLAGDKAIEKAMWEAIQRLTREELGKAFINMFEALEKQASVTPSAFHIHAELSAPSVHPNLKKSIP